MKKTVHFTPKSGNKKTGPIPVSTSSMTTCPPACPFNTSNSGGCYANGGPLALHWRKVTEGTRGDSFDDFCDKIATLPAGQLWRHNQAGDLAPGYRDAIDATALRKLITANEGRRGFTYTHFPMLTDDVAGDDETTCRKRERAAHNQMLVREANANSFTINLSGNNPDHADLLAALDVGPVVTVLPVETEIQKGEEVAAYKNRIRGMTTPAGRKVTVCPATYLDDVSCATCGLCQLQRAAIVGFPAHGASKRKASAVAGGS